MEPNYTLEDTQPRPALALPHEESPKPFIRPDEDEPAAGGPGCAVWGCVGVGGVALAVFIVLLAGFAGWTSGKRQADVNATATRGAEIGQQLERVPADLSSGNLQLAGARLRFLATMTPGVPGVADLALTATEAYRLSLPTETPTPTPTSEPTEATDEAPAIQVTPSGPGGQYDLAELLREARSLTGSGQYADAYELLDVMMAIDPSYEQQTVRTLLTEVLNGQARAKFQSNNPAQGIIWATRAENLGVLQGDVSYEMFAAVRWQDAQAAIGLNYGQAINALRAVMDMGEGGRYYQQARDALYQQYVALGDALVNDPTAGYCPAVEQYQNALGVASGGPAQAKRDNARTMCAQATPTPTPTIEGMPPEGEPTPGAPGEAPPPGA